jgi:alkanesulfonate monooxygenase SsuD/methylene tetrahydromethanopterin reductase-like flavin-dependent oxidoreductase (luciferase family)
MIGGGMGARALDRIATKADGWLPAAMSGPTVKGIWDQIRAAATGKGRDAGAMQLIPRANIELTPAPITGERQPYQGSMDQVIEDLAQNVAAGADELIIELQPSVKDGAELVDKALEIKQRLAEAGV